MSALHRERDDLAAASQHLLRSRGAGRAPRAAAEPASLAGRDGPGPGGRGRPRRRARPARRGGARVRRRLLTQRAPGPGDAGAGAGSRQGGLDDALAWARDQGLSADDDLSYLREFEHVTLARALLAQYASERAERSRRGDRAPGAPPAGGRGRAAGRGASSRSWCCRRSRTSCAGDVAAALVPLARALTLAEPEGYVRIFVDEGAADGDACCEAAATARDRRRPTSAGCWPPSAGPTTARPRAAGPGRAAERTRAGRAPAARRPT